MGLSEVIRQGRVIALCSGSKAAIDGWVKQIAQASNTVLPLVAMGRIKG
jgi:hypothetical protein